MKKVISMFLLLWIFGNCICIAAEREERIPLMASSRIVYTQQPSFQSDQSSMYGNASPGNVAGYVVMPVIEQSEEERLYQHGMQIYSQDKYAFNQAEKYFERAASKGHVGAIVQMEKHYLSSNLRSIKRLSYCCDRDCCKWTSFCFSMFIIPGWCMLPFVFNLNETSDEDIIQTHTDFDKKINYFSELESKTQDPILKEEISSLKSDVMKVRKWYDEEASLRCEEGIGLFGSCCNCKIRDSSLIGSQPSHTGFSESYY